MGHRSDGKGTAGRVALFLGSHRYLGHELREIGFRSYFREHASQFELLDSQVNLDDANIAYEATLQLIHCHPTLVGIAVAGGGMEGVIRALREENVGDRLAVVCNEVTPESRAALADHIVSIVIATPINLLARTAVAQMARRSIRRCESFRSDISAVRPRGAGKY